MASPFALLPLDYLIEVDDAPGTPGRVTEPGYGVERAPLAPWIMYGNLRDQEKRNEFAPYLGRGDVDDIGREYGERLPDPAGAGFWTLIDKQINRAMSLGARCIEWDNLDSHNVTIALRVFDRTATPRLGVAVKNPGLVDGDQAALIRHPAAQIVIVEEGAGTPAEMDALRRAAGKPDMPVRFVFYGDDRKAARQCAQQASAFSDMGVTFSPGDEYGHSEHLLLPRAATPLPPIGPIIMPDSTVTGADILAKARSYIGKFTDDDAPTLARAIGAHWPDLANYARPTSRTATTLTISCGLTPGKTGARRFR
jgi:hypothetical protein